LIETKPLPSNSSSTTLLCSDGCCPQLDWFTISLIKADAEQENGGGEEIVNLLKHVRPGNGFEFKGDMFDKVEVNGENEHPLFTFLKKSLPAPSDDSESLMASPHFLIWKPVRRTDIAWNFEKFLIGRDGTPIKRYSRNFLTKDIEADIKNCL